LIRFARQAGEASPSNALVWANRAACYLAQRQFHEAEIDARRCIQLDPAFVKAYYRLGSALFEMERVPEAITAINLGLQLEPNSSQLKSLKVKALQARSKSKGAIAKGFLLSDGASDHDSAVCAPNCIHVAKGMAGSTICQTCTPVKSRTRKGKAKASKAPAEIVPPPTNLSSLESNMYNELKAVVKKIKTGEADFGMMGGPGMLQGAFANLLNSSTFQSFVFPGSPPDVLEVLPKNLKQLLYWEPIELDFVKIAKNAASVLEGVKKRGASSGDAMDARTEAMLRPQVVQEALARELIDSVKKVSKVLSNWKAKTSLKLADEATKATFFGPSSGEEEAVLLEDSVGERFPTTPCVVQTDLMGEEWSSVILQDVARYCRVEKMSEMAAWKESEGDVLPRVAWIEKETVISSYPALAEALNQLQYLPFEINGRW
jgi:tetratricopeptide (TPR) repeat protein